jgi:hypothetical protein
MHGLRAGSGMTPLAYTFAPAPEALCNSRELHAGLLAYGATSS